MFRYSRDRTAEHLNRHLANYRVILQAEAYMTGSTTFTRWGVS